MTSGKDGPLKGRREEWKLVNSTLVKLKDSPGNYQEDEEKKKRKKCYWPVRRVGTMVVVVAVVVI